MMSADQMLVALADSRMSDDQYAAVAYALRRMFARCSAADRLAGAVLDAESYQPESVMAALGAFVSAGSDPVAA